MHLRNVCLQGKVFSFGLGFFKICFKMSHTKKQMCSCHLWDSSCRFPLGNVFSWHPSSGIHCGNADSFKEESKVMLTRELIKQSNVKAQAGGMNLCEARIHHSCHMGCCYPGEHRGSNSGVIFFKVRSVLQSKPWSCEAWDKRSEVLSPRKVLGKWIQDI